MERVWPSDSGELVRVVEREVEEVRVEWAESQAAITRHLTIISEMTGRLVSNILFIAHQTPLYIKHTK